MTFSTKQERSELEYVCKCGDSGMDHLSTAFGEAPQRVGKCKNCYRCEQFSLGEEGLLS